MPQHQQIGNEKQDQGANIVHCSQAQTQKGLMQNKYSTAVSAL
jgi:hypothetical protein